jgi:hypothetical protein
MADSPFSPEALRQSIQKASAPPNSGGIGVAVEGTDVGIAGHVNKPLGKGWSVTATGQWFKDKGRSAALWLGWTGTT